MPFLQAAGTSLSVPPPLPMEYMQVQEDTRKEEILHYMMTGTVNSGPCGGTGTRPDLTCYTGNGMMWWTRSHALSKLESLQCWAVGLALRKLELLHCKLPVILSKENLTMSSDIIRCHNPMEVT